VEEALQEDKWCVHVQEELNQFKRNEVNILFEEFKHEN